MTLAAFLGLVLAGIGAGIVGYLTGLASLVSYPALLAVGLTPVAANVSNTIGVVGIGLGATAKAASTLAANGKRQIITQVAVALAGGLAGAGLLLATGNGAFTRVVPWLVIVASVALLASPRLTALSGGHLPAPVYWTALFLVCLYGGYFGAGAGVIFLTLCLVATTDAFSRSVLLKTVLLGCSNLAASLLFIAAGPVNWWAAIAMCLGCIIGGWIGPKLQEYIPARVSRWVIGIGGFVLTAWLWLR